MQPAMDFLKAATVTVSGRPALTWGHVVNLFGETVAIAADGERMHIIWDLPPHAYLWGEHGVIPFPNSQAIYDKNSLAKLPETFQTPLTFTMKVHAAVCLEIKTFMSALACTSASYAMLIFTSGRGLWFVTSDMLKLLDLNEPSPLRGRNVSLCFNREFMLAALNGVTDEDQHEVMIEFDAAYTDRPMVVGNWGERAAVIMPLQKPKSLTTASLLGGM